MAHTSKRLSRPVYEGLPWFYVGGGLLALLGSYLIPYGALSIPLGALGLGGLLFGVVVLLRRRDYRKLRSEYGQYGQSDPSVLGDPVDKE